MANKQLIAEYAKAYGRNNESDVKWMAGYLAEVVELNDGTLIGIEKPTIQKDFCFSRDYNGLYDPESERRADKMANYASTNEQYFLNENLNPIMDKAKRFSPDAIAEIDIQRNWSLRNIKFSTPMVHKAKYIACDERIGYIDFFLNGENVPDGFRALESDEIERIQKAYASVIESFKKRLQTYLKRYGLSTLHVWTYYSD